MSPKRDASRSDEQMRAEAGALNVFSSVLGVPSLKPNHRIEIGSGWVSVDGFVEDTRRVVLVEVNAHIGRMKTATRNKVLKDAFKMLVVSRFMKTEWRSKKVRCVLVFLDKEARESFGPKTWANAAFDEMGLETAICSVTPTQRAALQAAQSRQDIRFNA
jgi:hypothetical protein